MTASLRVVLVSREVWPFAKGGGIGRYVTEAASLLVAAGAEVTILTSNSYAAAHAELTAAGGDELGAKGVRWAWADEPGDDLSPLWSFQHAWSLSCWRALRELAQTERPDVVEFEDYGGAAAVAVDATRAGDPALSAATLAVRLHTSWEMTQVLDGLDLHGTAERTVMALERHGLRFADRLIAPSSATMSGYHRFYGDSDLADHVCSAPPFSPAPALEGQTDPPTDGPMRLLFLGRLQRFKGLDRLVEAFTRVDREDIRLTVVGRDTATGPGGHSMRGYVERLAEHDARIEILDEVPNVEVDALVREHHVVVVPTLFESYGYVAREALAANRPVLATPVGGLVTAIASGANGWLTRDSSVGALADGIAELADRREEVQAMIRDGAPRASLQAGERPTDFVNDYERLAATETGRRTRRTRPAHPEPVRPVTIVVTLCRGDGPLEGTLESIEAQDLPGLEIVVVAEHEVGVPWHLAGRLHALAFLAEAETGITAARRQALALRTSRGPLVLLRGGERLLPGFLERGLAALQADPGLPYVTPYARGREPSCAPIGNFPARFVPELEVSASIALLRADALPHDLLTPERDGCEDEDLFESLAREGRFGAVIPEELAAARHPPSCQPEHAAGRGLAAALMRGGI